MNEERLSLSREHFPSSNLAKMHYETKWEFKNINNHKWQQIQSKNEEAFYFTNDIDIFILYIKHTS